MLSNVAVCRRAGRWLRAGVVASVLGVALVAPSIATAQTGGQIDPSQVEVWDVIQTTDGNVLKGVIVEQTRTATGTVYKIVLPGGGGTLTIPESKVARITKERNPAHAQGAAAAYPAPPQAGATYPAAAPAAAPAPAPGTAAYPPAAAPAYPPAASPPGAPPPAPPGYAPAPGAAPVGYGAPPADQSGKHHIDIAPPVATEGMRLGVQFGPYFPMGDLSDNTKLGGEIGFGGRIRFGYEFMFDRVGITPSIAVELANFSTKSTPLPTGENSDDSVLYVGVQPGLQAAAHLGHFAPYLGVTFGFDHYGASGKATDYASSRGLKTDANGFGFGVLLGLDFVINTDVSVGIGGEIHPGFTSLDPGSGLQTLDLGHAALLFEGKYHF